MAITAPPVRLIQECGFDRARPVLVESDDAWWPGWQRAWRVCDEGRGWMAEVPWTEEHDRGPGNYVTMVSRVRVQPRDDEV